MKNFLFTWGSQTLSILGSRIASFAITIYVVKTLFPHDEKALALAFTLLALTASIPMIIFAPVAGSWVDRFNRKSVMLVCDFLSFIMNLVAAILVILGLFPLWVLLIFNIFTTVFMTVHGAAFEVSFIGLVQKDQLGRANGMLQTSSSLAGVFSPTLATLLIAIPSMWHASGSIFSKFDGVSLTLAVNALSFLISWIVLNRIPFPENPNRRIQEKGNVVQDTRLGLQYIFARPPLFILLLIVTCFNFIVGSLSIFQTLIVKTRFEQQWMELGLSFDTLLASLTTVFSIGGLVGGVMVSSWGGLKTKRIWGVVVPALATSFCAFLLGFSELYWLALVSVFVVSFMIPILATHSNLIWMEQVPSELQGRVFSVRRIIAMISMPLSVGATGIMAAHGDPGTSLAWLSLFGVALLIGMVVFTKVNQVENREYLESEASRRGWSYGMSAED